MLNKIWNKTIFGVPMLMVQLCSIILGRLRDYISTLLWRSNISRFGRGGKIQSGAIVASGSVLFREVHAGKVVGGIPAKVIKEREKY